MDIRVQFVSPFVHCTRCEVEDAIEQWLGNTGEIVGGGAATDGSWAHIDIIVEEAGIESRGIDNLTQELKQILLRTMVPITTKIILLKEDTIEEIPIA